MSRCVCKDHYYLDKVLCDCGGTNTGVYEVARDYEDRGKERDMNDAKTPVVQIVPPISDDVADKGPDAVSPVSNIVDTADPLIKKLTRMAETNSHKFVGTTEFCEECGGPWHTHPPDTPGSKVKRQPVDYQYHRLNWNFIKLMALIANYASVKYGSVEQYVEGRLEGEKSPLNHICEHLRAYMARERHDRFGNVEMQLAAIAYNAMMEYAYFMRGGPTVTDMLYKIEEPK